MKLIAFDSPAAPSAPWAERMLSVVNAVEGADFDRLEYAPWSRIKSLDAMLSALAEVHSRDGEGLILRKPQAPYQPGYSDNIVKLKYAL